MPVDPQQMADAAYIVEEYEKKSVKQPSIAIGLMMYRPLKQAEDFLGKAANTLDPKNVAFDESAPNVQADKKIKEFYQGAATANRKGTVSAGEGSEFEFQNTWAALANDENTAEQKAATLLKDCLPCEARLSSLLLFNPLEPIMSLLQGFANELKNTCMQLLDALLNPIPFTANLCDFYQLLNFACIPDLKALIMLLRRYLMTQFKPGNYKLPSFSALIGAVLSPILAVVANLVTTWAKLVLGPVDCILEEITKQLNKYNISGIVLPNPFNPNDKTPPEPENPLVTSMKKIYEFMVKVRTDVQAFVDKMLQKFTSLITSWQQGIAKTFGTVTNIASTIALIKIIMSLINILHFDLTACGTRQTDPKAAADKAADAIKDMELGRIFQESSVGNIDSFIPIQNLTDKERDALGLPPLVRIIPSSGQVLASDEKTLGSSIGIKEDGSSVLGERMISEASILAIKGKSISKEGCPKAGKSFVDVTNIISSFE